MIMNFNENVNYDGDELLSCELLKNMILPAGYIPEEDLDAMPVLSSINGSWGPISWEIDISIDPLDILKSKFVVKIGLFGVNIINTELSIINPKVAIDATISGVGMKAELGIDFNTRRVYLSGSLNFILYKKTFNLTLVKF